MSGHRGDREENSKWIQPRPDYVREAEPQAHSGAWPSLNPIEHVDREEQAYNRMLFSKGLSRQALKKTAAGAASAAAETQTKKAG
jgi:hypothetical protein